MTTNANSTASSAVDYVFSPGISATLCACALLGVVTNAVGLTHVLRNFNVRKPIFLLILLDAAWSLAGSALVAAVTAGFLVAGADASGYAACTVFFVGLYHPCHTGLAFTAMVAIFRFFCIRLSSASNSSPREPAQLAAVAVSAAALASADAAHLFWHWRRGLPTGVSHEVCLRGPQSRPLLPGTRAVLVAPMLALPAVSIAFDLLILRFLRKCERHQVHLRKQQRSRQTSSCSRSVQQRRRRKQQDEERGGSLPPEERRLQETVEVEERVALKEDGGGDDCAARDNGHVPCKDKNSSLPRRPPTQNKGAAAAAVTATASLVSQHHSLRVPVAATVASALFTVPYLGVAALVGVVANNFDGEILTAVAAVLMVSLRAPLTVAITYRHDQAESRKRRRRKKQESVREFARKEREMRQRARRKRSAAAITAISAAPSGAAAAAVRTTSAEAAKHEEEERKTEVVEDTL